MRSYRNYAIITSYESGFGAARAFVDKGEYRSMDFEQARLNMIEQQIRTWEVLDQRVLDALLEVRREDYVPEQYRQLAFIDMEIPLGHGQVMMPPKLEARVLQALDLKKTDKLLEVGTGSGYLTALAAHFCGHVHTVEIVPELSLQAANRLPKYF